MSETSIVIQRPVGAPENLVLLLHGVGAGPGDMVALGHFVAAALRGACVVAVAALDRCDLGQGRQWFSIRGITDANRPERVAEALPHFAQVVEHWQQEAGVGPERTALVGFSQGAIMALELTQRQPELATRVLALSGRFAAAPRVRPRGAVHLVHGEADGVIACDHAEQAACELRALGARVTLDKVPGLGHGLDGQVLRHVLRHLSAGAMSLPATP